MKPVKYEFTRPGTVLPYLAFLCLGLIYMGETPYVAMFVTCAAIATASAYGLWRGFHVCVELSDNGVMIRTVWRTNRLRWVDISRAELRPMRTASPSQSIRSYPALALELADGRTRQYDDISAPKDESGGVADIADQINRWLERRRSTDQP